MDARRPGPATARRRAQAGVTLIEVVAVIAVMMVAVPPLTGLYTQVASASVDETYQAEALALAETLMEEIVSKAYEDPDLDRGSFGAEEGDRAAYDDVDDYDGLNNSPPRSLDGTQLTEFGGMGRRVLVDNVTTLDPDPETAATDGATPMKRIRVIVAWTGGRGGELTLSTLRARLVEEVEEEEAGGGSEDLLDQPTAASTSAAHGGSDKIFTVDLMNSGDSDLVFEAYAMTVVCDDEPPTLKEIRFGTDKVHKLADDELPTGVVTLNYGSDADRTIAAGATTTARVTFNDDFDDGEAEFRLILVDAADNSHSLTFTVDWGS